MRKEHGISALTVICIFMLFTIAMIYCTFYIINAVPNNEQFFSSYNTEVENTILKQLKKQEKVDESFDEILDNGGYTLEDPYVLNNPYGISPLTSLIFFRTKEETSVTVRINDGYEYKISSSKKHIIPVYGLVSNATNKVTLVIDDGTFKDIEIVTDIFNNDSTGIDIDLLKGEKEHLSLINSNHEFLRVFDSNRNLIYFLDMPFINNYMFYNKSIVLSYNSVDSLEPIKVEVDFMGRIKSISNTTEDIKNNNSVEINGLEYKYLPTNLFRDLDNYETPKVDNKYVITKSTSKKLGLIESYLLESPTYDKEFKISINGNYLTHNLEDNAQIIIIGKKNSYAYLYDTKDKKIVIGNSGEYSLYIKVDNKYYNLMKSIEI